MCQELWYLLWCACASSVWLRIWSSFLRLVNSLSYDSCWERVLALTIKPENAKSLFPMFLCTQARNMWFRLNQPMDPFRLHNWIYWSREGGVTKGHSAVLGQQFLLSKSSWSRARCGSQVFGAGAGSLRLLFGAMNFCCPGSHLVFLDLSFPHVWFSNLLRNSVSHMVVLTKFFFCLS